MPSAGDDATAAEASSFSGMSGGSEAGSYNPRRVSEVITEYAKQLKAVQDKVRQLETENEKLQIVSSSHLQTILSLQANLSNEADRLKSSQTLNQDDIHSMESQIQALETKISSQNETIQSLSQQVQYHTLNEQNQKLIAAQTDSDMKLLKARLEDIQSQYVSTYEHEQSSTHALQASTAHYAEMQMSVLSLTNQLAESQRDRASALDAQMGEYANDEHICLC